MGVYVNRILNLRKIKAIGLDMDYTLVRYATEEFERQTYKMAQEALVVKKGYPSEILAIDFDFKRAIRGLVIDEKRGNLLKISLYGRIKKATHGTRPLTPQDLKNIYQGQLIDPGEDSFTPIDTSFSLSHAILFACLIDMKDQNPKSYPSYKEIAEDVLEMIDFIHRDGSLKNYVTERMHQFFIQDKKTPITLERFKLSGKKLFIITNSDYNYTQRLLDYTLKPFLQDHNHWEKLFDIVITQAAKPKFFTTSQRFLKVNTKNHKLINVAGELSPGIYQGGNSIELQNYLNLKSEEILYLGDHIYGDILALKKQCRWRTALVVEEIDKEVKTLHQESDTRTFFRKMMLQKEKHEDEINRIIDEGGTLDQAGNIYQEIKKIDEKLEENIIKYQKAFNPYWGEVMRAGIEESRFAGQVAKYACIYMGKVSDLASLSPRKYFRPERRLLPHDPTT